MDILEAYFEILGGFGGFERRKAQERMVSAVWKALEEKRSLVVEAGTGSGKSFGYLIPAVLQQKRPIVISTGTIALQEQLLTKDIPFLESSPALKKMIGDEELVVKLVKGRRNYLCINKLMELERTLSPVSREMQYLDYLKSSLSNEWDGDRHILDFSVPAELWDEVASESDDCLGRRCQYFQDNPYRLAREDLESAHIIVANHALYLQDLVSGQSLLPPHDVVIFDEAHNLKRYALNAMTARIGKFATTKLLQKIQKRLRGVPEEYMRAVTETEARILHWLFARFSEYNRGTYRLIPDGEFLQLVEMHSLTLKEIYKWVGGIEIKQLELVTTDFEADKAKVQKDKLLSQLKGLIDRWEFFQFENPFAHDRVNWVETDREKLFFELKSTPLNIDDILGETLWPEKTAILTSATLSVSNSLQYCKQDLGMPDETNTLVLPSPFDYESQCLLYTPSQMPEPSHPQYTAACADEIEQILRHTQGRAFVLFTSNGSMERVASALIPKLPYPCKVQGDLPRKRIVDWFKETPNSVLFATATFWEGIDIPGDSLSCVIMDKLPFSPPDDPVNQATVDYMKARQQDWFNDFVLPQAIIKLKQGFGRLIRSKTDTGLVAILDPRLHSKGYGKRVLRSLPPVRQIRTLAEITSIEGSLSESLPSVT